MILFIGQRMENERAQNHAVHSGSECAFATTLFASSEGLYGTGIVLTLGEGNQLVCQAVELLGKSLIGQEIGEIDGELWRGHAAPRSGSPITPAGTAKGSRASCARFVDERMF
jgi:hypothetical protein